MNAAIEVFIEHWPTTVDAEGKPTPKGIDDAIVAGAPITQLVGNYARAYVDALPILDSSVGGKPIDSENEKFFTWTTAAELDSTAYKIEYLIPGIMARWQATILAGGFKTCKTTVAFDIGVSLASGTPMAGTFEIPTRRRVAILTAESGMATVQETCRRICHSRGITLGSLGDRLVITDRVPRLDNQTHLAELSAVIKAMEIDVVIADPAYLMMDGTDAANLFSMGEQLRRFADISLDQGATPVLLHHAKKTTLNGADYQPLELGDIAWSGFAEFARQWILLSRREKYQPGTGDHRLWVSVGGSAGHNGLWAMDIAEGHPSDEGGRRYEIAVYDSTEAREIAARDREAAKEAKQQKTRDAHRQKIIESFAGIRPAVLTAKDIASRGGLSGTAASAAIAYMLRVGEMATGKIKKANREYDAYELLVENLRQSE